MRRTHRERHQNPLRAKDIATSTGNHALHVVALDLAEPDSITAFVESWDGPLHVLVNNAGVMASPETRTAHGWELQFATNHPVQRC
jgi:NAD(P)-dependent dehydrogenase (short-subunit alcohol dehydrogenase family)